MILFISEQGSRLVKRGRVLMLYKNRERIFMFPLENVDQLVIVGRVEISTAMMGLLMRMGIDTVFLTRDGRYKGRLVGETSKNILLREKQFARRQDPEVCLHISRALLKAKLANTRNLVRRLSPPLYEVLSRRMQNALQSVQRASSMAALQGIEGAFAALYFQHFPRLLKDDMGFRQRIKHPPTDPINILLSLGYTMLFNTVYGLVQAAGLDPYAGFFHQSRYGHPALVSDLMEPYRAPLVDRVVIRLVNSAQITRQHFSRQNGAYQINREAIQHLAQAYQQRLSKKFKHGEQFKTAYHILQEDVWALCRFLEDQRDEFEPHLFS